MDTRWISDYDPDQLVGAKPDRSEVFGVTDIGNGSVTFLWFWRVLMF